MSSSGGSRKVSLPSASVKDAEGNPRFLFACPKKGRLYEKCIKLLNGSGLQHHRAARLDIAQCTRADATIVFLPAKDIAQYVALGNVDMGITGIDIIQEDDVDVETLMELGFGKCRLCVEAPQGEYKDVSELAGKRIVTSFPTLSRKFFDKLDAEKGTKTQIRVVSGSVEAACGLGLADAVVDLVETGTTMRAAGLEVVAEVMSTQTVLIGNPNSTHKDMIKTIHKRVEGYMLAQQYCMVSYNVARNNLDKAVAITPGHESPSLTGLDDKDWVSVSAMVKTKEVSNIMDELQRVGAKSILVFDITNCRM